MSGINALAPQASPENSLVHSNVSKIKDRSSASNSDFSRSSKAGSADSPSVGTGTETSPDVSSSRRHQHFHQQEAHSLQQCGSNQSGSDSGLGGCTNSISSENSLLVNATGIEQTQSVIGDDDGSTRGDGSVKHHGRGKNVPCRSIDDAHCGRTIDVALDNLSNNKISSVQRSKAAWPGSQLESFSTTKSDTRYLKNLASASSRTNSNSIGLISTALTNNDGSRIDDAQKGQQSSRSTDGDVASSTLNNDRSVPQVGPDKIDGARNNTLDPSHGNPSSTDAPKLRSALRKPTKTTADASNRSPKSSRRNVTFNQTVIVFCEEIETSSPGEFDPPVDYRDGPQECVDATLRVPNERDDSKSALEIGRSSYDLDILSEIVGQDVSKLTDEQLFELLEGGPLLKDGADPHDDIFIQRLKSNQGFLCQEAISDTDSECSLAVDESSSTLNQTGRHAEKRPIQAEIASSRQQRHISSINEKIDNGLKSSEIAPSQGGGLENDSREAKKFELGEDSQNRPAAIASQTSMPARVRVATIENQSKRSQLPSKTSPILKDLANHQSNNVAQTQQKVIHSCNQLDEPATSQRLIVKQTNTDTISFSKSQILTNEILNQNQLNRVQPPKPNLNYQQMSHVTAETDTSHQAAGSKPCCAGPINPQSHMLPVLSTTARREGERFIQSSQGNPACHICKAIESNRQTSDLTSLPSSAWSENSNQVPSNSTSRTGIRCANQVSLNINHPESNANSIDNVQNQRMLRPDTSTLSCASCQELTLRQQYEKTSAALNVPRTAQVPNQPQARPIACQIVYVVDQNGNRIRALQLLRSPQPICGINVNQPGRQLIGAPVNIRLPHPSSFVAQQTARQPIYVMQNASSSFNSSSTGSSQRFVSMGAVSLERQSVANACGTAPFIRQMNPVNASHQPMRVHTQSGPRNHTVYYVRQPLGLQNLRDSTESPAAKGVKPFPDAHEIRRLDGIRAPTVEDRAPRLQAGQCIKQEYDTSLGAVKDDSEDPSFGFSNRPAVKVVSSVNITETMPAQSKLERQNNFPSRNAFSNEQTILGSQTLDRQVRNRSNPEVTDGIPTTSSMYGINQHFSNHNGHSVTKEQNSLIKSKGDQRHPVSRELDTYLSGNEDAQTSSGREYPKPEVAYIMNI